MVKNSIWRRARVLAMASLVIVAAVGVPALGASAESKDSGSGSGAKKGCTVENVDDNGNTVSTSTVPEGTRIGLFYCKNGEWRFGTVILDHQAGATGAGAGTRVPVAPVGGLTVQR